MPIETELTRALGIRIPILQAAMMHAGMPKLAAAVSNGGGLGILTGLNFPTPEGLREAIKETRSLTNKPFAVNLTFLPSMKPPPYAEYTKVIIEEGVKVVETAGSAAAAPSIAEFKKAGIYCIHKCTTIKHAKAAVERMKVDCVSVDGFECAGHPGEEDIPGLVLLARAAQELKCCWIASGGFADGRGLAAALALGAQGINCGTRFQCTVESPAHPKLKETMVRSTEKDTVLIFRTLNNSARVYKNKVAEEVVAMERRPGGCEFKDIAHLVAGSRGKTVYETGDPEAGIWSCGISVGLINDIPTCADLLATMERDAEEVIAGLRGKVKLVKGNDEQGVRQSKL